MSPKFYGTTGKILRVDLSKEKVWEEELNEAVLHKFIGGTAMGVKYIYDEVDPKRLFLGVYECICVYECGNVQSNGQKLQSVYQESNNFKEMIFGDLYIELTKATLGTCKANMDLGETFVSMVEKAK